MWKPWALICLLCLAASAGCINVKADASNLFGPAPSEAAAPDPSADPRTPPQLVRDNAQLRQQVAASEKDHFAWQAALRQRQAERDALDRQRDQLKKQRDRDKKDAQRKD